MLNNKPDKPHKWIEPSQVQQLIPQLVERIFHANDMQLIPNAWRAIFSSVYYWGIYVSDW